MTIAAVDSITPAGPAAVLPVTLAQTTCRSRNVFKMIFAISAALVLLSPFGLLASVAAADPAAFVNTAQRPSVAIQLSVALLVSLAFVAVPMRHVFTRTARERAVTLSPSMVSVVELNRTGSVEWREPLANYTGVAHNIRTSLSGARHEVILVHAVRSKSVILQIADRIAQSHIDSWCSLTGLPEIHAKALHQPRPFRPRAPVAADRLQAA